MTSHSILVVDDESDIRSLLMEILSEEGYEVSVAADAAEARTSWEQLDPDLVLLDIWMPDMDGITLLRERAERAGLKCPVVMMSGHGTVDTAVEATRLGAVDFIEKPLSIAKLLRTVETALGDNRPGRPATTRSLVPELMPPIGKSPLMRELRESVQQVARHNTPVLFVGESGTGREAFARYLHSLSSRAAEPLIRLVVGSLTEENAAVRLFGSESRSAVEAGLLEQAQGGVLYLNELQDLVPGAQRLLAASLEAGGFARVGGQREIPLDVRFLSSVQPGFENELRKDLLAHLGVVKLRVPPLREYAEDVPELLRYYADKLVDAEGLPFRRFEVAAQNRLRNYPWPGNIRDLKNLVHRLLILGGATDITLQEIERELAIETPTDEPLVKQDLLSMPLREAREQFERAYLQQQLQLCDGKVGQLAKRVGMERTHLYRKLRSLGVDFRQSADD